MKRLPLLLVFSLMIYFGCSSDNEENNCVYYNKSQVTDISCPDTINYGETIKLDITFLIENGCGEFYEYKLYKDESSYLYNINITSKYVGCVCPEIAKYETKTIDFFPPSPGKIYFAYIDKGILYKIDSVFVK